MEDVLKKISRYDIFVYLVPGCLMVVFTNSLCNANMLFDNLVIDCLAIYSYGIIADVVGTFVFRLIEKMKIIKFIAYDEYIRAKNDNYKINVISRKVNIYKAIIGAMICSLIIFIYYRFLKIIDGERIVLIILEVLLAIIIANGISNQVTYMKKKS